METDSSNVNALSNDDSIKIRRELSKKTLNPENDLLHFLEEMNFKLIANEVKYPKVIYFFI